MKFYLSTYTEGFFGEGPNGSQGIYLCQYNKEDKEIKILSSFNSSINPSFIKLTDDKKYLFVASETLPPSRIDNYQVDEDGMLHFNDRAKLNYRSPCYMSVNAYDRFCAVANYGSGSVFTYMFDENYRFEKKISLFKNRKNGPNQQRQECPHAHSIRLIESLNIYVSCDLGCDKIDFYDYKTNGYLKRSSVKSIKVKPGYGPRHSANTKDGKYLYITCELANRVLCYRFTNGQYKEIQDISSLEDSFKGLNTCADIHLSNDEQYLFVSNRGNDNIMQYQITADGTLQLIKNCKCGGQEPRNFAVYDDFIICANENSNNCSILELKNGLLTGKKLASSEFISPVCVEIFKGDTK